MTSRKNTFPDNLDYNNYRWSNYQYSVGKSGILRYSINENSVWIEFNDHRVYLYPDKEISLDNLSRMKELARQGQGLNSFINQNRKVKDGSVVVYTLRNGVYKKVSEKPHR